MTGLSGKHSGHQEMLILAQIYFFKKENVKYVGNCNQSVGMIKRIQPGSSPDSA